MTHPGEKETRKKQVSGSCSLSKGESRHLGKIVRNVGKREFRKEGGKWSERP